MQGRVSEKIFAAAIIKTNLNHFAFIAGICHRQVAQPVMRIHAVAPAGTASAVALTSTWFCTTTTASHVSILDFRFQILD
jgi:hypothetical protein